MKLFNLNFLVECDYLDQNNNKFQYSIPAVCTGVQDADKLQEFISNFTSQSLLGLPTFVLIEDGPSLARQTLGYSGMQFLRVFYIILSSLLIINSVWRFAYFLIEEGGFVMSVSKPVFLTNFLSEYIFPTFLEHKLISERKWPRSY